MQVLKVKVPDNKQKIKKQIGALEWQIKNDKAEKDIQIHQQALNDLYDAVSKGKKLKDKLRGQDFEL